MKTQTLFLLGALCTLLISCSKDDLDQEQLASMGFTNADLVILNRVLNLDAQLHNYSNPSLPDHYLDGPADEFDNTPEDNPITDMGATLGRVLFYDRSLSVDNRISCASCHRQQNGFSDPRRFSRGVNGEIGSRNSMGLINARYYENGKFFWDERAASLEEQVLMPIEDHKEMGMNLSDLEVKLGQLDYYEVLFERAFGSKEVTSDRISKALAQFVRSIISVNSKFDRGLIASGQEGDLGTKPLPNFTDQENEGMDIFLNRATCVYCHGTALNVNDEAKNNGLELNYADGGKGDFTGIASDEAEFKVPSLRNIEFTAPYMHDGRFATLMDVVNHYSDNVQQHENLNFRLTTDEKRGGNPLRLGLTQSEKEALVAFLRTLSDDDVATAKKWSNPFRP